MTEFAGTQHHSSSFLAVLKQSYRNSLASLHQAALSLHARQSHAETRSCSYKTWRAVKHIKIFAIFTAGLFTAMAPWALAALEVIVMTALYVVLMSSRGRRPWRHIQRYHYSFRSSLEDLLLLTVCRFIGVVLAYILGSGHRMMRPYFVAAVGFAVVSGPFLVIKAAFTLRQQPWVPAAVLIAASAAFSVAHLGTARNMMLWARKRYELGLMGFGFPWEEGEARRLYHKHRSTYLQQEQLLPQQHVPEVELLPEDLADPDSLFINVNSVKVHYKIVHPEEKRLPGCMIVLLHPFGGGAFSFRLLMKGLADDVGCPVLTFDRPGAGMTSRPANPGHGRGHSPYAPDFAADIAHYLCRHLHIKDCVFVGQADGSAVAVLAAARCRSEEDPGQSGLKAAGLVLLHPTNLEEGEAGSAFSRLLINSRIGRQLLQRMLRADSPNRAEWADPAHVTPEIIELYKRPSKLQGWGDAMVEVTRSKVGKAQMQEYLREVQGLPVLIVTGAKDRITTPQAAAAICNTMHESTCVILPTVGHLSNEEAPRALVACLATFCKHSFAALEEDVGKNSSRQVET